MNTFDIGCLCFAAGIIVGVVLLWCLLMAVDVASRKRD